MRAAKDQASLHIRTPCQSLRSLHLKKRIVDEGWGQIVPGTFRICEQRKDHASLHIDTVSPDNVWMFIYMWVTRFVTHLREKW